MSELIPRNLYEIPSMNRLFRDFFEDSFFNGGALRAWNDQGSLAVDVSEGKNGETIVRTSLPGYKKEDVNISINNNVLTIRAETKAESETKDEKFYRKERTWGAASRSIALPGQVSEENVKAELKDGILTVRLTPSPKATAKRIEVK
ncbi:MAG: Hsp20/alpha crystallin family protein [Planctomycetes bacterium]|nr:Hsp20/alpha crystallin family protein [Planctomycetota bacterium]